MPDIFTLYREIVEEGHQETLARDPRIQFGTPTRQYLGATILPERQVRENSFSESDVRFFATPANDATRYSEPQMKAGELGASQDIKLGEIDIARQLTGRDFDNIRAIAATNPNAAKAQLIAWLNTALNLSIVEKEEIQRWQLIVDAIIRIRGTDGKTSDVGFASPPEHRITIPSGTTAAPTGWYGAQDPMEAIFYMKTLLNSKGYELARIIGDSDLTAVLATNQVMQGRLGVFTVSDGTLTQRTGLVSKAALDAYFGGFGLPAIEEYNLTYRSQTGTGFFKPRGAMVFVAATGRSETIDLGDAGLQIVENTAGYYAIGTAVGEDAPGRVIRTESRNLKPVGIYGQGFQTSLPINQEAEGIGVISVLKPA